jgi:hypothetical protein
MRFFGSGRSRSVLLVAVAVAVLVLCVGVSPSFAFKSGAYSGTSAQQDQVGDPEHLALKVNKAKTKVQVIFFELYCPGLPGLQYAGLSAHLSPTGTFKALSPGDGFYGYVKGKFSGRRATGTVTYDNTTGCVIPADDAMPHEMKWTANHKGG